MGPQMRLLRDSKSTQVISEEWASHQGVVPFSTFTNGKYHFSFTSETKQNKQTKTDSMKVEDSPPQVFTRLDSVQVISFAVSPLFYTSLPLTDGHSLTTV